MIKHLWIQWSHLMSDNNETVLSNIDIWNLGLWKKTVILYQPRHVIYFCMRFKLHKMEKILIRISRTDTLYSLIARGDLRIIFS